jgi:hypothetical protein
VNRLQFLTVCGLAALLTAGARASPAQHVIKLSRTGGIVGLEFDGYSLQNSSGFHDGQRTFREYVNLQITGSVLDPRVLLFDVGLRPRIEQTSWNATYESSSGGSTNLDARLAAHLFSRGKISLQAEAMRLSNNAQVRFDEEQSVSYQELRLRLNTRFRPLPLWIELRNLQNNLDFSRPQGVSLMRDEQSRSVWMRAQNSKTFLEYQHVDFSDNLYDRRVVTDRATATHHMGWGKGSSLRSILTYSDRAGVGPFRRFAWNEYVNIRHTLDVQTDLRFRLFDQVSRGLKSKGWFVDLRPQTRLAREAHVALSGLAERRQYALVDFRRYELKPMADAAFDLPAGMRLIASGAVGYRWQVQSADEASVGDVLDERHEVDQFGRFILDEISVISSSVLITSEDRSVVFEEGIDYQIFEQGPRTEVLSLPGGRIQPQDIVLVSYSFRLIDDLSSDALLANYNVNLQLGPLAFFNHMNLVDPAQQSSPRAPGSPGYYQNLQAGVAYQSRTPFGSVDVRAEYDATTTDAITYQMFRVRATLSARLLRGMGSTVGVAWQNGLADRGRPISRLDANAAVNWSPIPRLALVGALTAYRGHADFQRDTFLGFGLGAEWSLRRLRMFARYDYRSWDTRTQQQESRIRTGIARFF